MMELASLQEYLTSRAKIDFAEIEANDGLLALLGKASDILTYGDDGSAHIQMTGPLTPDGPDIIDIILGAGGTSYKGIISSLQEAEAKFEDVKDATTPTFIHSNSPGGLVSGAEATSVAVTAYASKRPLIVINEGVLASAALWVACGATEICSAGRSTWTGSIGAVMTVTKPDTGELKVFNFVNPESKAKIPDPEDDAGAKVYEERVRAMYCIFREDFLAGRRGKATQAGIEGLNGTVVTAPDAITVGLIDSIIGNAVDIDNRSAAIVGQMDGVSANAETGREETMNLAEYLAKYPAAKAEVDALTVQAGIDGMKDAVSAQALIVAKLKPFMESDAYPKRVQAACVEAIAGERNVTSVLDLVALFEQIKGEETASLSEEELANLPETPAAPPEDNAPVAEDEGWNDNIKSLLGQG